MHEELDARETIRHAELMWIVAVMHSDKRHRPDINDFLPERYKTAPRPSTEETLARIDAMLAEEEASPNG